MQVTFSSININAYFFYEGIVYRKKTSRTGEETATRNTLMYRNWEYFKKSTLVESWVEKEVVYPKTNALAERKWYDDRGQLHRTDGPASITLVGTEIYYWHGKKHRVDGPAIINLDGDQWWWNHGVIHRADGPAITRPDGYTEWVLNGIRHRVDGPALTQSNGTDYWYWYGRRVTEFEHMILSTQEQSNG